jgi:multicomponent Na+:H+ antiporter subunit D
VIEWLHPAFLFILGALLLPWAGAWRGLVTLGVPILALADVAVMRPGTYGTISYLGANLVFGQVDKLALVFAWVFVIMAVLGAIYAWEVKQAGHHMASMLYVAGSLGSVFAGDWMTLFIFWELMAFSSVFLVWYRDEAESREAGFRYLLVHVLGGALLLMGLVLHTAETKSLLIAPLAPGHLNLAGWLILLGIGLNAAILPLHAWLPDAYPRSTVAGAVFMCAFTTKTAVYALARVLPGQEALVYFGTAMTLFGVIYAVIENDIRKILAYHIISQVGYMVAGVGIGNEMAMNGACAHAFAHILYKALLFMGAGALLQMAGTSKLSELGGLWRTMPLTMIFYIVGAVSISGFPLFSGFVSKSMVVAGAHEGHRPMIFLLLNLAGVGTFLSVGLKVTWFAFFNRETPARPAQDPPRPMLIAMGLTSALCFLIGVAPGFLYHLLPFETEFNAYSGHHLSEVLQILTLTGLVFGLMLKKLTPGPGIILDVDWFYRRGADLFLAFAAKALEPFDTLVGNLYKWIGLNGLVLGGAVVDRTDRDGIDQGVNAVGRTVQGAARLARNFQSGRLQTYLGWAILFFFLILWLVARPR